MDMKRNNLHLTRRARSQAGFTLIEILVAMLILAIGMLGIAAMQLRGLQYNHDAYLRSQVNLLAYDISDRMRLNSDNAASYVQDNTIPNTRPACTAGLATVANDLNCWVQQGYDALPPGSTMNITAGASGSYTAAISWTDREGQSTLVNYVFIP